jgi:hypothetical protein
MIFSMPQMNKGHELHEKHADPPVPNWLLDLFRILIDVTLGPGMARPPAGEPHHAYCQFIPNRFFAMRTDDVCISAG